MTIRALAARVGITHPRISQLENGDEASRDMVTRLAAALSGPDADERTATALLNAGLKAAGFASDTEYDADPDIQMIVEAYSGSTEIGKRAIKSAAELAMEMAREGSIGKRAE